MERKNKRVEEEAKVRIEGPATLAPRGGRESGRWYPATGQPEGSIDDRGKSGRKKEEGEKV